MTHETFRELAPLYVIGALDGVERVEFERYLAANRPRCEAELAEFQAVADQLALAAPAAQPSPEVFKRVMTAVEGPAKPASPRAPGAAEGRRKGFGFESLLLGWIPWTATVAMCVLLVIMTGQMRTMTQRFLEQQSENEKSQAQLTGQIAKISQLSSNLEAQAGEFKAQAEQLRAENETLERDAETLKATNGKLAADKIELLRVTDELRQQVARQDAQVTSLQTQLSDHDALVASLQKQLGEQNERLGLLMDPAIRLAQLADPKNGTKATARVYWQDATKQGLIIVSNLQPILEGEGKDLELWALCGDQPPVPGGLFWTDATGHGVMEIKLSKESACADKFAVTIEPEGGVQAPTGPVVLVGQ
jgi:anti-sigma-K factor RskA